MLSLPAYTEEMAQRGEFSRTPGGGSLFNPQTQFDGIASPYSTEYVGTSEDAPAIEAFMRANGINDISQGRKAYFSSQQQQQQQQAPNPFANEPGRDANGVLIPGYGQTDAQIAPSGPTPGQQLNTPSFEQLAQPMPAPPPPTDYAMPAPPPPSVTPVPITQPTPGTSNLIQQIQAPVAGLPPSPATMPGIPVSQPSPGATNLIQQIQAPTTPRPVAQPNRATQQFAQQFRPPPVAQPRPQPRPVPKPVARPQPRPVPKPVARPQPIMAPKPAARSVSRVNPPLLPSRPMGRR
jgi:hypothetical protein